MGFIFTLISRAIALYQYGAEGSLDSIVRNFGIAIASTITGITLRIIFNQMRRDPIEVEHYSRLDLAEASNRVRRELDGVEREFQHFRRSNQQMLSESFDEVRAEVARSAAASLKASQVLAEQVLGTTKATNEIVTSELRAADLKAELDQTTKNLKRVTTALAKACDQIEKSAGSFVTQISSMAPLDDRLQPVIEHLDASIQQLSARLEQQTKAIETVQAGMEQTADIERNIARIIADENLGPAGQRSGIMGLFRRRVAPEVVIDEKPAATDS
jgi:methyl-accepting chemotaxis protein